MATTTRSTFATRSLHTIRGVPTGLVRVGTLLLLLAASLHAQALSIAGPDGIAVGELATEDIEGVPYVAAADLRGILDGSSVPVELRYRYTPAVGSLTIVLRVGETRASVGCQVGSLEVSLTGRDPVSLHQPPVDRGGAVWLPVEFLEIVAPLAVGIPIRVDAATSVITVGEAAEVDELGSSDIAPLSPQVATDTDLPYTPTPPRPSSWSSLRVMVDPGHGGVEPGVSLNGLSEAALALDLAREIRRVGRSARGRVALTRDRDVAMTAGERAQRAEASGSTVYLTVHFNSSLSPTRSGYRLVIQDDPSDLAATKLSASLHAALKAAGFTGGEVRLPMASLRGAAMTAIHLEVAHLSNPDEARMWMDSRTPRLAAEAIWAGLSSYRP
jgi:N-acetylmuramoyl-L-alanine amidase